MKLREQRSAPVAFAAAVLALAQIVGCGSCVKDEPQPTSTGLGNGNGNGTARKPIPLQAADQRYAPQFPQGDGGSSESVEASTN